ncbi:MAG TPA: isoprenylcysteine carboxylmethyltransferase family protein [Steroidobacteraceae bacterium]|jgi:protein-S-isoprenylcysteine O-methyltransferase|nr:isoprenylcysteine carboxylmethyltransferase family protein [Steroidobacteraceae bacterium]
MNGNVAPIIGAIFGISEMMLTLATRRGQRDAAADAGSLRLIWIVVGLCIAAQFISARAFPQATLGDGQLAGATGLALFVLGAALRWYAIFYLGRYFTVDVRVAEHQHVVDTGPYRLIRHPSYTGAFMQFLGLALCIANAYAILLLVPIVLVFLYRMRVEESALERGLGEAYASYRRRTKRLIPFVY